MKKIGNFLLALVVPKRMRRFIDNSPIISIFILLVATILSVSSNMLRMNAYVEKTIPASDYESLAVESIGVNLPKMEIDSDYKLSVELPSDSDGVFVKELGVKDSNQKYEVTIVFDTSITHETEVKKLSNLDLEGYYHQKRKENTTYLLYVFTESVLYQLHDLGQTNVNGEYVDLLFTPSTVLQRQIIDDNANFINKAYGMNVTNETIYYLPKDDTELKDTDGNPYLNSFGDLDTTRWTAETSKGVKKEFIIQDKVVELEAVTRHEESLNKAVKYGYSYLNLIQGGLDIQSVNNSLRTFIIGVHEGMIYTDASTAKLVISIMVFFVFLILPLVLALLGWLFMRKRGMSKFINYLAIASIITIPFALLLFIIGWFTYLPEIVVFIALLGVLWYYVFALFRINTAVMAEKDAEIKNQDYKGNNNNTPKPNIQFRKIDDDTTKIG